MKKNNQYISETGHLKDEYLNLYIEAHLINAVKYLPSDVLEHVENCKLCKDEIINGYDTLKDIQYIKIEEHPYFGSIVNSDKELRKTNFLILYRIAASIIFIISIGTLGYYFLNNELESLTPISEKLSENHTQKDGTKEKNILPNLNDKIDLGEKKIVQSEKDKKEINLNDLVAEVKLEGEEYKLSPIITSMLGSTTRSDYIKIQQPKDSTYFKIGQHISFAWKSELSEEIKLTIFNNTDELIFESDVLKEETYNLTKILKPGVYYWKIESIDDMHHLGVFFIAK